MYRYFYRWVFISFLFIGCSVKPYIPPQDKIDKLSLLLQSLDKDISQKQSKKLSKDIFQKTAQLTKAFKLTSPPLWHNTLVGVGLKKKGLCYHWSDALYSYLLSKNYTSFEFHLVGANIGKYFSEHNALVVVSKKCSIKEGIIVDPWRNSGKLYFSKVNKDKKYQWKHRIDRGCPL